MGDCGFPDQINFDLQVIILLIPAETLRTQSDRYASAFKETKLERNYLPSLKQVHVVKLVELHREFHCGLDFGHGAVYRQRCFTSSEKHLTA